MKRRHSIASMPIARASFLLLSLIALFITSACQTPHTAEQASSNASVLADALVEYVWEVDPEIYFGEPKKLSQIFERPPRAMAAHEHGGRLAASRRISDLRFDESRLFALELPLARSNAWDSDGEADFPALFCMLVSAKYEADVAVYNFEFFTPKIAHDSDYRRLVRNGVYVADVDHYDRSARAIPTAAAELIAELRGRDLPLQFGAELFAVDEDHTALVTGAEFLMGSGRVIVSQHVESSPPRLDQLQALVRLRDGLTARDLYDQLLTVPSVRQTLAAEAQGLTRHRQNRARRAASAQADIAKERARDRRRSQARARASASQAFSESLTEGAQELENWQREQAYQSIRPYSGSTGGGAGTSSAEREIAEKMEAGRVKAEIEGHERKIAAQDKRAALARAAESKKMQKRKLAKLQDEADDLEEEWSHFTRELVFIGRDLKRTAYAEAEASHAALVAERKRLEPELEKAGLDRMHLPSNDNWFLFKRRELERRTKGVRSRLTEMEAPRGEGWNEHHVETVAGVEFHQRVRARTWPDKAVDLAWRVVNTNDHPVWHSLDETAPNPEAQFYLWGGSDLKPGASHTHVSVSYEPDRSYWRFEAFVRRQD